MKIFATLSGQRQFGMGGPQPLAFSDMLAWAMLTGRALQNYEVQAVLLLDRLYITAAAKAAEKRNKTRAATKR